MPVKAIKFDHNGQDIQAEVVYNFDELSNAVLIVPTKNSAGINENILLVREKSRWQSSSPVRKRYPSTFNNIVSRVNEELRVELNTDHYLLVRNLLS